MVDERALRQSVDAQDWAKAFMSVFGSRKEDIDEGVMIAWFANYRFTVEESVTHAAHNEFTRFMESLDEGTDLGWEERP